MAKTVYCDSEDGNPALVMLSNLETGEVLANCAYCWAASIRAMADALAPGPAEMPPAEAEAAAEAAGEGEAAPDPPRPKRRRQGPQSGPEALTAEASPFPDPTPVDG